MNKIKSALVAVAVLASVGVMAAPAHASECKRGGGIYICEYGVTTAKLSDGRRQEFIIGLDRAVWTRWPNSSGSWGPWISMGGLAQSKVFIQYDLPAYDFIIHVVGNDGARWYRGHDRNGNWTNWDHLGATP
ncbi:hypothetical protein [Streptomyces sp. A5-4]|uniref:hypothetical protein n=1 Tax=Streptomyces sp. A5-4 TaxID=3384771 RepID=UPI003DA7B3F8